MKRIQYQINFKMKCNACGHEGYPYIKMIRFKSSKKYSASANCQKCGQWIENVKMQDVEEKKIR